MSYELDFAKNIWQTLIMVSSLILFILASIRYKEKKSEISKILVITFGMFFLAMVFQIWSSWIGIFNLWNIGSFKFGDPNFILNWFLELVRLSQMAYIFLILGLLFLYKFAFELTRRDIETQKKYTIATLFTILIILWGVIRIQIIVPTNNSLLDFILMLDPYVILFCFFMSVPIITQGRILLKKVPNDDPMYPKIRTMTLMGIFIYIMTLSFIIETMWGMIFGEWTNLFSFLGFGFALCGLITAYISFYKR